MERHRIMRIERRCLGCQKEIIITSLFDISKYKDSFDYQGKRILYCSEECESKFKKDFDIEVYNNQPIYMVTINDEVHYMPYWGCHYYFTTIEDCKKRMDSNVSVVDIRTVSIRAMR